MTETSVKFQYVVYTKLAYMKCVCVCVYARMFIFCIPKNPKEYYFNKCVYSAKLLLDLHLCMSTFQSHKKSKAW